MGRGFGWLGGRRSTQGFAAVVQGRRGCRAKLASAVARAVESLERRQLLTAVVQTDKDDYAPGSTAHITAFNSTDPGTEFQIGETVQFQVLRSVGANVPPGHEPWRVRDGYAGDAYFDASARYVDPTTGQPVQGMWV